MSRQDKDQLTLQTEQTMRRFHEAFDRHDAEALVDLVAADCVIENTNPAPDGRLHTGKDACLRVWQGLISGPGTRFTREEVWASRDRAIVRWRYHWCDGGSRSVRGVNLMRVHDGQIVEAMGYVKCG